MDCSKIPAGANTPQQINVIIEIPANSDPIKYEIDKASGALVVDRFVATPMFYPANYGFIPNTLAEDGDPLDVLVISQYSLLPAAVISCRPVGVLLMDDESGGDSKIIAVPHTKLTPAYDYIKDIADVPELLRKQIEHYFEHYKKLEAGKWVKIKGWDNASKAQAEISKAVAAVK